VFFAAGEAVLVALNAKTGQERVDRRVADNRVANMSVAPLIAGGHVLGRPPAAKWASAAGAA
jgi:hypothetical protein